jgi:hypothetical protein
MRNTCRDIYSFCKYLVINDLSSGVVMDENLLTGI